MFELCWRQKSPRKKDEKDHTNFLYSFFRSACVTSSAIWTFHPVLNISIFIFFFLQKTWKYYKTHVEKVNPTNCWVDSGSQLQKVLPFSCWDDQKIVKTIKNECLKFSFFLKKSLKLHFGFSHIFRSTIFLKFLECCWCEIYPRDRPIVHYSIREVWMTPLVKCLSYVENKNVREKKIKKITHVKKNFIFFS